MHFDVACPVLYALVVKGVDRSSLLSFRYARYWHGYNALTAFALRVMDLKDLRFALTAAVWSGLGILAVTSLRASRRVRLVGLAIALSAATTWAVPYFAPGLTHGPGDTLLLAALAVVAARPTWATKLTQLVPFAVGFGAIVAFFEMFTGQLPIAAAWLTALTLAAARDHEQLTSRSRLPRLLPLSVLWWGLAPLY